ncbi:hypothetical protein [Bacillus tuaregi]|uniref:hypothetical protein n=1 Tax=Bacillus tuaregi TaxID=1816695 RepID=UPI0008F95E11|nr:hypothetical protein [Bacillus tuaregi]
MEKESLYGCQRLIFPFNKFVSKFQFAPQMICFQAEFISFAAQIDIFVDQFEVFGKCTIGFSFYTLEGKEIGSFPK